VTAGACQHAQRVAGAHQLGDQCLADKAGTSGDADGAWSLDGRRDAVLHDAQYRITPLNDQWV